MKIITALAVAASLVCLPAYALDYDDALSDLKDLRIMVGADDGMMHENDYLSRSEAIAIIMRTTGFDDGKWYKSEVKKFNDVPLSHWASGYIYKAESLGIVNGVSKDSFLPMVGVTYAQAVKMVVELIKEKNESLSYPDGYMKKAEECGILNGIEGNESGFITRGQFAALIHNALDFALPENGGTLRDKLGAALKPDEKNEMYKYSCGGGSATPERVFSDMAMPSEAPSPEVEKTTKSDTVVPLPDIPDNGQEVAPGQITAGKWNDIENYSYWRSLMANSEYSQMQRQWEIPTDKYDVIVKNGDLPAGDCVVKLTDENGETLWASRTDKNGMALVYAKANEQQSAFNIVTVAADGAECITENVILDPENPVEVSAQTAEPEDVLDLMFTIDTTGSMSDELRYINAELTDVVNSLDTNVRLSCNYYRDATDAYTVKPFDFTTNVENAVYQMSQQYASGGGDYEEAVDLALLNSINEHDWSESAKARLLFLVLDAPPHFTPEIVENINTAVKAASEKGIRIIPVASSGVDKGTEFFLRSLALATNGRYIFLTDDSGIGYSHIEPTIGDYTVSYLNELISETINEYIK